MSKDQKSICENCKWWKNRDRFQNSGSLRPSKRGDCRVGRPEIVDYVGYESEAKWPGTMPDDWCGEFTSRPLSEEDRRFINMVNSDPTHELNLGRIANEAAGLNVSDEFIPIGDAASRVLSDIASKRKS